MEEKENLVKLASRQQRFNFKEFLFHLLEYQKEDKTLNVKQKFVCKNGYPLGQRVMCVRSGKVIITQQQKAKLTKLGFVWNAKKVFDFDTFLDHLNEYKRQNKTAKVNMTNGGYVCSDGYKLGRKVGCIRTGHIKLSDKQKHILDKLGFVWHAGFDFEKFCEKLKKYQQINTNPNSLYIKRDVVIDGYNLGINANHVRAGEIKLSAEQKAKLDAIGFVWDQSRDFDFDLFFIKLMEYKQKNKSLLVKKDYVIDGYALGNKITNIRTGIIRLSSAQREKLNDVGFAWTVNYTNKLNKFNFDEFYQNLVKHKQEFGNLLVPFQTVVHNYELGFYARNIRNFRIDLTNEQKIKLTNLGFIFNTHDYYLDKDIPLIEKMINGDALARKKVIEEYMPYVAQIIRTFSFKANYSDLLDIANNTLILCVDRCKNGDTFKSYLKKCVKGSIKEFLYSANKPKSLSSSISKIEDITLEETIADNTYRPDTEVEDRTFSKQLLLKAKEVLSVDEYKLLCLHFGFNKKAIAYSNEQLAVIYKTTLQKVQNVMNRILLKLKQNLKKEEWLV